MKDFRDSIEEFERDGKKFIFFDISGLADNDQFEEFAEEAKKLISKYPPGSVYVLTSHITFFDTATTDICSNWIVHNKPYVIASALVDIGGLTRMVAKGIYSKAGRELAAPFATKEEAIQWLLTQDSVNWDTTS